MKFSQFIQFHEVNFITQYFTFYNVCLRILGERIHGDSRVPSGNEDN